MNDLKLIDNLMEKDFIDSRYCRVNCLEMIFCITKEIGKVEMQFLLDNIESKFYIYYLLS